MNFKYLLFLLIGLIFAACNSSDTNEGDEKILKEAAKIHLEAIEIEKTVKPKLDELIQRKNQLSIQGRALSSEEQLFINQVDQLQASYDFWESNHVEVEGGGHDHDHDHHGHDHHGHDHDHGSKLDVLPADMLIIQKEFRDSIISLKERVEKVNFK